MLTTMTSRYHDSGILALGFSMAVALEGVIRIFTGPGAGAHQAFLPRLVCGVLVGPLIVTCLFLRATLPHRIVLALGLVALIAYVFLALR